LTSGTKWSIISLGSINRTAKTEKGGQLMPFDFSRLRGRIVEKFGTCEAFAARMGRSKGWISTRLNNVVPWGSDEIKEAADLLGIPSEEIHEYFFAKLVR
jgi:hypothetical protein